MSGMMALLPVIAALLLGVAFGVVGGGSVANLLHWRPAAWEVGAAAIVLQALADLPGWSGVMPFLFSLASLSALIYVTWMNRRIGGMVVVAIGLTMNLLPLLVNGGLPVSGKALVSSGVVEQGTLRAVQLTGPRHIAQADDLLRPLGATIPLPFGVVISPGDIVALAGLVLVTQAVLRRRQVRTGGPVRPKRNPKLTLHTYREALDTLGQGPADNSEGLHAEHHTSGASGNVRAIPIRPADEPARLDTIDPVVEERADDGTPIATVRPVPRPPSDTAAPRFVPPHGDVRPAPSGVDPDTDESAIVAPGMVPPWEQLDDSAPPGWTRPESAAATPPPVAAAYASADDPTPDPDWDPVLPDADTAATPVVEPGEGRSPSEAHDSFRTSTDAPATTDEPLETTSTEPANEASKASEQRDTEGGAPLDDPGADSDDTTQRRQPPSGRRLGAGRDGFGGVRRRPRPDDATQAHPTVEPAGSDDRRWEVPPDHRGQRPHRD